MRMFLLIKCFGGDDEYYFAYCSSCGQRTEHDVCTGECVSC